MSDDISPRGWRAWADHVADVLASELWIRERELRYRWEER